MRATIQAVQPWATSIAIIVGALVIGAAIVGTQFVDRYEISAVANPDGPSVAWRVNTRTGDVQICRFHKDENDPFKKLMEPYFDIVCQPFLSNVILRTPQ